MQAVRRRKPCKHTKVVSKLMFRLLPIQILLAVVGAVNGIVCVIVILERHSIDIRVVHKDDDIILRIRDDCVPFNPRERKALTDPNDILKNAGIRIVYQIAKSVDYQNLLGLNVLTIRI